MRCGSSIAATWPPRSRRASARRSTAAICRNRTRSSPRRRLLGALLEGLIGPLAPEDIDDPARAREAVQTLTLFALRGLGVVDARARGLVVQTVLPDEG